MIPVPVANPPNPWSTAEVEYLEGAPPARLQVFEDHSKEIIARNDSPDLGFTWSINPYRGCFHGCAYCYARPTHEYLSFGAGTDFERKIVVKPDAPRLLARTFDRPNWKGELLVFSGVTDCYQPLEASYRLTRGCLEVCLAYKNPVAIITKAPLVERDVELLAELNSVTRLSVTVSIPFWNAEKARAIEPYVASPARRIHTIAKLARYGIDVGVNVAPLIPGLSDEDMVSVLEAAAEAGAKHAGLVFLRLPGSVKAVFLERLRANLPLRADRVLHRIEDSQGGRLYDARFGKRGQGTGEYASAIKRLFDQTIERLGLCHPEAAEMKETFERPSENRQLRLL